MKKITAAVAVLMAIQGCSSLNEGDAARYSAISASNKAVTDAKIAAMNNISSLLQAQAEAVKSVAASGKGDAAMVAMAMAMSSRDAADALRGLMDEKQQAAPETTASQLGKAGVEALVGAVPMLAVGYSSWALAKTAETGMKNAGGTVTVGNNSTAAYKGSSVADKRTQGSNVNSGEVQKVVGGDNTEKPEEPAEEPEPEPEPKEEEK